MPRYFKVTVRLPYYPSPQARKEREAVVERHVYADRPEDALAQARAEVLKRFRYDVRPN